MITACAIIAGNYLPFVRVLADSFFVHHPDGSLTVLLIDDEARQIELPDARIDWRRVCDIGLDPIEIHRLAGMFDVAELSGALKPALLRRLLDEGRTEVIYLDPDVRVYASLEEAVALARQHGVVLTPHTIAPVPKDDRQIDDLYILAAGTYNLGFIAVSQAARAFLDWWWQATRREGLIDVAHMMFADQRWIDFAPALFEPYILKDPGYNVAYWNLHARHLTLQRSHDHDTHDDRHDLGDQDDQDATYLVDGVPLRFFHFSGFDVQTPWLLSRHQGERPRVLLSEHPVLSRLCRAYAISLARAGLDTLPTRPPPRPYGWRATAAGFPLSARMRRLYWHALRAAERRECPEPPDPFDTADPQAFPAWLNAPAEGGPRRVSRYLYSIYLDRPDLRIAFPDIYGIDAARFAEWIWRDGIVQEQILLELLPPRAGDDDVVAIDTTPPLTLAASPRSGPGPGPSPGLNIAICARGGSDAGCASGATGSQFEMAAQISMDTEIGAAARLLAQVAEATAMPYATLTVEEALQRQQHPFDDRVASACPYDINLLCAHADATPRFARDVGPAFFAGRHTVGYWFWDVEPFPVAMYDAFHHVDEVWAATDFMAERFRAAGLRPVHTIPLPVPARVPVVSPAIVRARLGLPARYLFLTFVDFLGIATRKNPLALIEAFSAAFAPDEGPVLVIASVNGHLHLPQLEQVRMAAAARADIVILACDRHEPAGVGACADEAKANTLLGICDCYVSLHRAEGLGLTMAEAMTLGTPIIATGYSGNRHFMTPENSYLIDYTLEAIPAGCDPHPAGGRWAAPDLDHAARLLRDVYDHPADAARRGRRGQADVLNRHGIRTAAAALTHRVEAIRDARRQRMSVPQVAAGAALTSAPAPAPAPQSATDQGCRSAAIGSIRVARRAGT